MGGAVVDEGPTGIRAPDGGWGWAVLFGCFVITGFSYAFPKAVSVFFKELMREFGIGYSDTAWISSILLAMLYGTGKGRSRPVVTSGGHQVQFWLGAPGRPGGGGLEHRVPAAPVPGSLEYSPGAAVAPHRAKPGTGHVHLGHSTVNHAVLGQASECDLHPERLVRLLSWAGGQVPG